MLPALSFLVISLVSVLCIASAVLPFLSADEGCN